MQHLDSMPFRDFMNEWLYGENGYYKPSLSSVQNLLSTTNHATSENLNTTNFPTHANTMEINELGVPESIIESKPDSTNNNAKNTESKNDQNLKPNTLASIFANIANVDDTKDINDYLVGTKSNENSNVNKVGKSGDFYTSTSLSKFFGGAIARYILRLLEENRLKIPLFIVEIGSNNGDLIADIAEFLKAFNAEIFNDTTFCTLEPTKALQEVQEINFSARITNRFYKELHFFSNFTQMRDLNENIFFISNELFDSMPCDIVKNNNMLYYKNHNFIWEKLDNKVLSFIENYAPKGSEIPIFWESFIKDLSENIHAKWVFLSFDYGEFSAREINLRIFLNHKVYNFLQELDRNKIMDFFKKSDITYDVDFSLLQRVFTRFGAHILFCETQAKMLIEICDILDIFESFSHSFSPTALARQRANLQGLIMPNAMGERFKCLCVEGN